MEHLVQTWTVEDVRQWVYDTVLEYTKSENLAQEISENMRNNDVDGKLFYRLRRPQLKNYGVKAMGVRIKLYSQMLKLRGQDEKPEIEEEVEVEEVVVIVEVEEKVFVSQIETVYVPQIETVYVPQIETVYVSKVEKVFVPQPIPAESEELTLKETLWTYHNKYINKNKCTAKCGLNQKIIDQLDEEKPQSLQEIVEGITGIGVRKALGVDKKLKFVIGILPILHPEIDTSDDEEFLRRNYEKFMNAWEAMKNFVATPEQRKNAKESLLNWRNEKANSEGKNPEKILSTLNIQDILKKYPQDVMQFHMCYGCKKTKIRNHCKEILAIFNPEGTFAQKEIVAYTNSSDWWLLNRLVALACEVKIETDLARKIQVWRNDLAKHDLKIKNYQIFSNRILVNVADAAYARGKNFNLVALKEEVGEQTFGKFTEQWQKLMKVVEDFRKDDNRRRHNYRGMEN